MQQYFRWFLVVAFALLLLWQFFKLANAEISLELGPTENQSLQELLSEAQHLFLLNRPIDARAKLQRAAALAPEDYRPQMMLGVYYLAEVAHFRLAYRYLRNAEHLFANQFGDDFDTSQDAVVWREHARLLQLIAEARLNLDDYQGALDTLDEFGARYWDVWYPGSRAWVLMKLRRLDEAIEVAQRGLLEGADLGKTYNILGILLSLKGNRPLAIEAFGRSIRAELMIGGRGQISTPLNNSGEVYREMFQDDKAEAAWLKALSMRDGCDHILPSLNIALLYIDELRLLQAERTLEDFKVCFAANELRADTEHRALLALGLGRIALHKGEVDKALESLAHANERQQWFGKIGTTLEDLQFAAAITLAQALRAKAATYNDQLTDSFVEKATLRLRAIWYRTRAGWLERRARERGIDDLAYIEDLWIRNTDAMVQYPTLGSALVAIPTPALRARIERMLQTDSRAEAHAYYKLYLAQNLAANGRNREALELLEEINNLARPFDRLLKAEIIVTQIKASSGWGFFRDISRSNDNFVKLRQELYQLLPSHLRYHGLKLPVILSASGDVKSIVRKLGSRFEVIEDSRYALVVSNTEGGIDLQLSDTLDNRQLSAVTIAGKKETSSKINEFIEKAFLHQLDPVGRVLPELEILQGML